MEQVLAEIRKLQGAVEAGFGTLGQKIDALDKRIDSLEKRTDSLERRIDSLERRVTTLAEQLVSFGKLLDMLIDEQRRLARAQAEMSDRLSEMMKASTQARTEDVARFLAFEERLLALELKN